mmetsp:Transcript_33449/g.73184  ORF Transcript_33449/g.73184 Transcript_33449/m.73184 type:complete len:273 (-) Transcript_33449:534-1352(-)
MEARRAELDSACKLFLKRLTGPGDFLTGERRASIVKEASCVAECSSCYRLRHEEKGPDFFHRAENLNHSCLGSGCMGCLVHCIANLQEFLDADWYEAAVEKFAGELVSSGEFQGGQDERAACLTELIAVVAGTTGIRQFYTAIGVAMPPLPPTTEGAALFKHVSEFCSGNLGRTGRAWGYQVMKPNIVASGLEKIGQSPSEWMVNVDPMNPDSKLTPTPLSLSHLQAWMEVMYVPSRDVAKFSAPVPPGRCLDRPTMEMVASTYAGAVQCAH